MNSFFRNRFNVLSLIAVMLIFILLFGLSGLQLVQGGQYKALSENRMYKTMPIKAQRGEIVDRYGRPIVSNKMVFSVVISDRKLKNAQFNLMLADLLEMTLMHGYEYTDNLPIGLSEPYEYRFDARLPGGTDEGKWKKNLGIAAEAAAPLAMEALQKKFGIDESIKPEMVRRMVGLRYDMQQRMFGPRNQFLFMTDVNFNVVSIIKENTMRFIGVDILTEPVRDYPMGEVGAHIIGQVDIIYQEEYESLKAQGYAMNDLLGKSGLEKVLEKYLKGQDGRESMEYNAGGKKITVAKRLPPVPGNRAVVTIDAQLQKTAEESLAQAIGELRKVGVPAKAGGAAVAIEIGTGEVLALANYPTYNPATYKQDYAKLVVDSQKPMFNRAISGAYPPGSTFKMVTACAGLQEGVISTGEHINCTGRYEYYAPDYRPACWIFGQTGGVHGYENVTGAITDSCNIFFFETGRRLGAEKLGSYARQFGLGEYTGIELSGEAKGIVAGEQYRKSIGGIWYPGDTIQAAIGQSDNLFTPLQLANYVATFAAKGARYKPHIVKSVSSWDGNEVVSNTLPQLLNTVDIKDEYLKAIVAGMVKVTTEGSAKNVFADAAYTAAAKTGTAQVPGGLPNSVFVAFAPYDNPQIAVACMIEHGSIEGQGFHIAGAVRKIIDAYFGGQSTNQMTEGQNVLIR